MDLPQLQAVSRLSLDTMLRDKVSLLTNSAFTCKTEEPATTEGKTS
jgi:hypothetical protein